MAEDVTLEPQDRLAGVLEMSAEVVGNISALIETGQRAMVLNIVADLYAADLERVLSHLPFDKAMELFHWLPEDKAGEVLAELDSTFRSELLERASTDRIAALVDELETDDAADVLADLPEEVALEVLPNLEDAVEVQALLDYDEETAGGLMDTEYVAALPTWTVDKVTEEVRRNAEEIDIYAVFVIDEDGRLQGIVPLKRILLSKPHRLIGDLADDDVIYVQVGMDQEEVARIMERYDLVSLPVVDDEKRLVGRITIDDIVDVLREEAEEDIQRMSGISGDEEPTHSVLRISRGRLPWLLIGMAGAGLAGTVIGRFEDALEQAGILAAFIPVVMAMAGNAGIQSSAIVVQGLASGDVWTSDMLRRLGKETSVALINGLVLAFVIGTVVILLGGLDLLEAETQGLALTAGVSLFIVILLATFIGTTIPLILHRFHIDPALATGPFITTSNDIIGLAVFFTIATLLYL